MEKRINFLVNVGYYLTVSAMIIWGVKYLVPMLMPFLIAFLVAAILNRPVQKVSEIKPAMQKPAAIFLTAGVYILLVFLIAAAGSKVTGLLGGYLSSGDPALAE